MFSSQLTHAPDRPWMNTIASPSPLSMTFTGAPATCTQR
jgi:hypothetical protein